jgi:mannose-1-phosphate guanylyltransferase
MTEAILLVGGQGTRLRPLTLHTAKPMLPVAGVPFLTHQLARLRDAGVDHVVLATSYRAETFSEYFGDGSSLGLSLEYEVEDHPLGTGGAIRNASGRLRSAPSDPVVILNGDVLSSHDIAAQVAELVERNAAVSLHLVTVADPRAFGCVPTDGEGRVTAFLEKDPEPVTDQINAGCYVFRRSVIDSIPAGEVVSVERSTFPGLLERGELVLGRLENGYWLDLGTPEALVQGSCDLVKGSIASSALPAPAGDWLALDGAEIAPDALVRWGTALGRHVSVGAGAVVEACIVLDGAVVGAGAVLRRSIVGAGARVGEGCALTDCVVGDGADVGARNELAAGARVWVDAVIPAASIRFSSDA